MSVEKTRPSKVVKSPKQSILEEKKIDDDSRTAKATLREDKCFRTHIVFETLDDEGASLIEACINGDKECEDDKIENLATKIDIKEVAMNKITSNNYEHGKTFSTLVLVTWAIVFEKQHKIQETEGGDEGKLKDNVKDDI